MSISTVGACYFYLNYWTFATLFIIWALSPFVITRILARGLFLLCEFLIMKEGEIKPRIIKFVPICVFF